MGMTGTVSLEFQVLLRTCRHTINSWEHGTREGEAAGWWAVIGWILAKEVDFGKWHWAFPRRPIRSQQSFDRLRRDEMNWNDDRNVGEPR